MHAGQILLLTKLLTATDLHFYDFEGHAPLHHFRPLRLKYWLAQTALRPDLILYHHWLC